MEYWLQQLSRTITFGWRTCTTLLNLTLRPVLPALAATPAWGFFSALFSRGGIQGFCASSRASEGPPCGVQSCPSALCFMRAAALVLARPHGSSPVRPGLLGVRPFSASTHLLLGLGTAAVADSGSDRTMASSTRGTKTVVLWWLAMAGLDPGLLWPAAKDRISSVDLSEGWRQGGPG